MIYTRWKSFSLILLGVLIFTAGSYAQDVAPQTTATPLKSETNSAEKTKDPESISDSTSETSNKSINRENPSRQELESEEEAAILPYYNNYLQTYHLGPEDVISVEVFGQPNYSKAGIVIPPTSRISYPLIPGGVFVGGKTTEEIAEEIKKKLNEYIIDPQVTVTLEKVGSARFSVLGKVNSPGVKVMNRRYNVYEAVVEAGGIAKQGDKKRILLVRLNPQGGFTQTVINFDKLLDGKAEVPYLVPGDQIIVPEKKWSLTKIFDIVGKASAFRILFGVPF